MAHKKNHHWFEALKKDVENLPHEVEKGMAESIKLAVEGTEFATKLALLPVTGTLSMYKKLRTEIKDAVAKKGDKHHSDNLDEVDQVQYHQEAAEKLKKEKKSSNRQMMIILGGLAVLAAIVIVIKMSKKS